MFPVQHRKWLTCLHVVHSGNNSRKKRRPENSLPPHTCSILTQSDISTLPYQEEVLNNGNVFFFRNALRSKFHLMLTLVPPRMCLEGNRSLVPGSMSHTISTSVRLRGKTSCAHFLGSPVYCPTYSGLYSMYTVCPTQKQHVPYALVGWLRNFGRYHMYSTPIQCCMTNALKLAQPSLMPSLQHGIIQIKDGLFPPRD